MIHVAHIIDRSLDTAYFRSIAQHTDRSRFRVSIGSVESSGSLQVAMSTLGTGTFSLGCRPRGQYLRSIWRLARWLRRERVDILHAHTFYATLPALIAAKIAGTSVAIYTRHHSDHIVRLGRPLHVWLDRMAARAADHVIAVSEATRNVMVGIERTDPARISVVHNGIDPFQTSPEFDRAAMRDALGVPRHGYLAVTVARLHEEKGQRYLLRAIPRVLAGLSAPVRFVIAGAGNELNAMLAEAEAIGVRDSVDFLGSRADIADIMAASDLFVLPSLAESFGFVLVESMWLGVPAVATNVGGIPEIVEHGRNGLLVPPAQPGALADAIIELLSNDDARARFGRCAQQTVQQRFTAARMVRGYEAVYDRLRQQQ